jgi:hypothetical protein
MFGLLGFTGSKPMCMLPAPVLTFASLPLVRSPADMGLSDD